MTKTFRFSPQASRAHEIAWREWGPEAFDEAARLDLPILLNLTAVWCHWCRMMDETTYSDAGIIADIGERVLPIRVDADIYPHVQDRYIAGGWPTNAFLTPTGEVLWSGTYVDPDEFRKVLHAVTGAWTERRDELKLEIERRRRALHAARSRQPSSGLVRREAADDVLSVTQDSFDPRNGGFGTEPKFPVPDAIEPLFVHASRARNDDWANLAERTLDGMLAGELWDDVEGGFFRYATAADWTAPRYEKLLETNAAMLRAYALGAALRGRQDWRTIAERIVAWVDTRLTLPGGLWSASEIADEAYYKGDAAQRAANPPAVDPILQTNRVAQWIRALAEAGARLGKADWIASADRALPLLLDRMSAPDGSLYHYSRHDAEPELPGLLADALEAGLAALSVAQATGRTCHVDAARRIAEFLQKKLWADDGGFYDHCSNGADVGALRYRDRPFELNAQAARLFQDLALLTGERGYRAIAERTLAVLSPLAGRYGVSGAVFALAVEEFFDPPTRVLIVGGADASRDLRHTALALPIPDLRVYTLENGGRFGTNNFRPEPAPAAYYCNARSCSAPLLDPAALAAAASAAI